MGIISEKKVSKITFKNRDIEKDEDVLKIIITGKTSTGNTTMLKKFIYDEFDDKTRLTLGVEFFTAKLTFFGRNFKLQFWDLAGGERWSSFQPTYYTGGDSVMLIFDLTRPQTLDEIDDTIKTAEKCDIEPNRILLVGNKSDLTDQIAIPDEYALKLVKKYNLFDYIKTSAKNGMNIEYVFKLVALIAMYNRNLLKESELKSYINKPSSQKIVIEPLKIKKAKKKRVIKRPEKTFPMGKNDEAMQPYIDRLEEIIEKVNQKWLLKYEKMLNVHLSQIKKFRKIMIIFFIIIIILSTLTLVLSFLF